MEIRPGGAAESNGQVLQQSLGDKAQLDMAFVGRQLAANRLAVTLRLAMRVLRTLPAPDRIHVLHPEVEGIGADGVNGLLETDLDFEPPAIEADDLQRLQGLIGAEQNQPATGGMDHPDKPNQAAQLAPEQIKSIIAQGHARFPIDRAERLGELLFVAEPVVEFGFEPVSGWPSASLAFGGWSREISNPVAAQAADQVMALSEQAPGEFGGGLTGVGHHGHRPVPGQADEQSCKAATML